MPDDPDEGLPGHGGDRVSQQPERHAAQTRDVSGGEHRADCEVAEQGPHIAEQGQDRDLGRGEIYRIGHRVGQGSAPNATAPEIPSGRAPTKPMPGASQRSAP